MTCKMRIFHARTRMYREEMHTSFFVHVTHASVIAWVKQQGQNGE